jgi:importin subunit beta-1
MSIKQDNYLMDLNYLVKQLFDSLDKDKVTRDNCNSELKRLASQDYEDFMSHLSNVIVNPEVSDNIRQLAGIVLKNNINDNWFNLDRESIVTNLIKTISTISELVSKSASSALAVICRLETSRNNNIAIIDSLLYVINNNNMNNVIECLCFICEEFKGTNYKNTGLTEQLISFVFNTLSYNKLKLMYHLIPLAKDIFVQDYKRSVIMSTLFNVNPAIFDDKYIEQLIKCAIQISLFYYKEIAADIDTLTNFSFSILNSQNPERIVLLCIEIWCTLGENELSNSSIFEEGYKSNKYFEKYAENIIEFCLNNIHRTSDDDSWSISKACSYILSTLVQVTDSKYLERLLLYVQNNFTSKPQAMLVLCCCLETVHKDITSHILKFNFDVIFERIQYDNEKTQTASWLFCKITELYCHVIEKTMLSTYIPKLLDISIANQYTRVNLSKALCNIIIHYGDKKTKKNNNQISPYYTIIIERLTRLILTYNNDTNYPIIQVIATIIEYSSDDFQEYLEDLLSQYIIMDEDINKQLTSFMNSRLMDIQENLCTIFQEIFTKIIRQVREEICIRLFNVIIDSFRIRKGIMELGLYCISYIALSKYIYNYRFKRKIQQLYAYLYGISNIRFKAITGGLFIENKCDECI